MQQVGNLHESQPCRRRTRKSGRKTHRRGSQWFRRTHQLEDLGERFDRCFRRFTKQHPYAKIFVLVFLTFLTLLQRRHSHQRGHEHSMALHANTAALAQTYHLLPELDRRPSRNGDEDMGSSARRLRR